MYYCPSQARLAVELAKNNPEIILGNIEWNEFSDGFPNLKVLGSEDLIDVDVSFLANFHNSQEIFRQLAVIYALPSYGINSLKVFLPFFSTGTMDRVAELGQIVTAKTLARMLSAIPTSARAQIIIFDIHALQEQFYFSDTVRVHCVTGINLLLERLKFEGKNHKSLAIAFPDEGAYKRYGQYFNGYEKIICEKRRVGEDRVITIKEGNPQGREVMIVDDLILSGSTMLECVEVLTRAGASRVYAYATHGSFPQGSWQKFLARSVKLYLTNSCPEVIEEMEKYFVSGTDLEIISLAPTIAKEIIGTN